MNLHQTIKYQTFWKYLWTTKIRKFPVWVWGEITHWIYVFLQMISMQSYKLNSCFFRVFKRVLKILDWKNLIFGTQFLIFQYRTWGQFGTNFNLTLDGVAVKSYNMLAFLILIWALYSAIHYFLMRNVRKIFEIQILRVNWDKGNFGQIKRFLWWIFQLLFNNIPGKI
jgi:hypothetical protein